MSGLRSESRTVRAKQETEETQFDEVANASGRTAIGYRRSRDFDPENQPGQDAVAARVDESYAVGCIADGVSQSFYGNLAAAFLVDSLLSYLWLERDSPPPGDDLAKVLATFSTELAPVVAATPLSPTIPEMVRVALEQARAKGSQAVFAAYVLNLRSRSVKVYLVGDIGVLLKAERQPIEDVVAEKQGRWGSAGTGHLLLKEVTFSNVEAILLKSDGASAAWGRDVAEAFPSAASFRAMIADHGHEDDVSFVTTWAVPRPATRRTTPTPPPESGPATDRTDASRGDEPVATPRSRGFLGVSLRAWATSAVTFLLGAGVGLLLGVRFGPDLRGSPVPAVPAAPSADALNTTSAATGALSSSSAPTRSVESHAGLLPPQSATNAVKTAGITPTASNRGPSNVRR